MLCFCGLPGLLVVCLFWFWVLGAGCLLVPVVFVREYLCLKICVNCAGIISGQFDIYLVLFRININYICISFIINCLGNYINLCYCLLISLSLSFAQ